jgi:hypothetical protein
MVGRLEGTVAADSEESAQLVAIQAAAAARLRWGRCSRNRRYSNIVDLPIDNLTRGGR